MLADGLLKRPKHLSSIPPVLRLIESCQYVDAALSAWSDTVPSDWRYETAVQMSNMTHGPEELPSATCLRQTYVYRDIWITKTWNAYRTARLFVQACILNCLAWHSEISLLELKHANLDSTQTAITRAQMILREMVQGVCASVPENLDHSSKGHPHRISESLKAHVPESEKGPILRFIGSSEHPTELAGLFLLWPLIVARSAVFISKEQESWINAKILDILRNSSIKETETTDKTIEILVRPLFGV